MKSWTQDHKSTSQAPQPLSHNVSNNADKIHVNVTFTIIFHIYFKIQGVVKWRLKENYKDHSQTILETIYQLGLNWANWALGLKNLSFKMRPSMCQKSHDTWIIFYSVFSHCLVLLLVSYLLKKKKKEWYPLVILNSDFALFNHRQITLLKYLWQITQ